ncbi:MAG: hypothetical protein HY952_02955 [Elusimicrobia bacterium]|nr:hypothetical protein [Elusimicrobiota bacterium]
MQTMHHIAGTTIIDTFASQEFSACPVTVKDADVIVNHHDYGRNGVQRVAHEDRVLEDLIHKV